MSSTGVPALQLALDVTDLSVALEVAAAAAESVEIIEAGTILLAAEGLRAVRQLKDAHSNHQVVADLRISRAGKALAQQCVDAGADLITVMAEAPMETIGAAVDVCSGAGAEVQIELGDEWTSDDLKRWRDAGISHVITHRGHEADSRIEGWGPESLLFVHEAAAIGFCVSVTGGISDDEIASFSGCPVGVFIAGRSVRGADDVSRAARVLHDAIARVNT
jgi:3-dehydro-L-gulonate-6-phosphate decarboxylase